MKQKKSKSKSKPRKQEPRKRTLGVLNGGVPGDLYSQMPCRIGYEYLRLKVDGTIISCCVADHLPVGRNSLQETWFSDSYAAFREKLDRIHVEKFHLKDPEWAFCQQCPHEANNVDIGIALGFKVHKHRE